MQVELINAALMDNLESLLSSLRHKTGFEPNYCSVFSEERQRPHVFMEKNEDQPVVRLASPSINVLDYSRRNSGKVVQSSVLVISLTYIMNIIW